MGPWRISVSSMEGRGGEEAITAGESVGLVEIDSPRNDDLRPCCLSATSERRRLSGGGALPVSGAEALPAAGAEGVGPPRELKSESRESTFGGST